MFNKTPKQIQKILDDIEKNKQLLIELQKPLEKAVILVIYKNYCFPFTTKFESESNRSEYYEYDLNQFIEELSEINKKISSNPNIQLVGNVFIERSAWKYDMNHGVELNICYRRLEKDSEYQARLKARQKRIQKVQSVIEKKQAELASLKHFFDNSNNEQ